MATYKYSALSQDGKKVNGVVEGFDELDAVARIKERYSIVLQISEVQEKGKGSSLLSLEIGGNKLNDKAFTLMCSQFAVILKAGVPIRRTVELIAEKMTDKPLKRILENVAKDVEAGRSLSTSFAERGKKLLPVTFLESIRAGEEAGSLDAAFGSAAEHYTRQSKMKGKVRGALIYPVFVLIVAIIVVIVLMVKVVPTFTAMFDSYDVELPLPTQMLIAMSGFFQKYWLVILGVGAALGLFFKLYGNTESGRLNLARLQLKLPVLQPVRQYHGDDAAGGPADDQGRHRHQPRADQLSRQPGGGQDQRPAGGGPHAGRQPAGGELPAGDPGGHDRRGRGERRAGADPVHDRRLL